MINFIEYMWYLLTTPMKKLKKALNKWYILCKVFGRRFDEVKEDILRARDEGMVATCSHEMLPVHGADRRLTRYEGEHLESYRSRIAMYDELCKLGGTNEGVLLAVKTLGYVSPQIVSANKMIYFMLDGNWMLDGSQTLGFNNSGDRWAEFYIVIVMDVDEEHPISFNVMKKAVRRWKEVGAKDNYLFRYRLSMHGICSVNFLKLKLICNIGTIWGYLRLGRLEKTEYTTKQVYNFGISHTKVYEVTWHEQHNLIFFDGTWEFDGSKTIDAWQKTEVM